MDRQEFITDILLHTNNKMEPFYENTKILMKTESCDDSAIIDFWTNEYEKYPIYWSRFFKCVKCNGNAFESVQKHTEDYKLNWRKPDPSTYQSSRTLHIGEMEINRIM